MKLVTVWSVIAFAGYATGTTILDPTIGAGSGGNAQAASPSEAPLSQIGDGQIQATTAVAVTSAPELSTLTIPTVIHSTVNVVPAVPSVSNTVSGGVGGNYASYLSLVAAGSYSAAASLSSGGGAY